MDTEPEIVDISLEINGTVNAIEKVGANLYVFGVSKFIGPDWTGEAVIFNSLTLKCVRIEVNCGVSSISVLKAYEKDVCFVAGCDDGNLRMFSPKQGLFKFQAHDDIITTVSYNDTHKLIASGGFDGRVCLWDALEIEAMNTETPKAVFVSCSNECSAITALICNENQIIFADESGYVYIHTYTYKDGKVNTQTVKQFPVEHSICVNALVFNNDILFCGCENANVYAFRKNDYKLVQIIKLPYQHCPIVSLAVNRNTLFVANAEGNIMRIDSKDNLVFSVTPFTFVPHCNAMSTQRTDETSDSLKTKIMIAHEHRSLKFLNYACK